MKSLSGDMESRIANHATTAAEVGQRRHKRELRQGLFGFDIGGIDGNPQVGSIYSA
jgi:hypothetical protein